MLSHLLITCKFFLFTDDWLFIKVLFVKPSFDPRKELTILINWNTKLPLGKSKDGIRLTGISLHENQHLPSNSASNLEAVDFSDEVII